MACFKNVNELILIILGTDPQGIWEKIKYLLLICKTKLFRFLFLRDFFSFWILMIAGVIIFSHRGWLKSIKPVNGYSLDFYWENARRGETQLRSHFNQWILFLFLRLNTEAGKQSTIHYWEKVLPVIPKICSFYLSFSLKKKKRPVCPVWGVWGCGGGGSVWEYG